MRKLWQPMRAAEYLKKQNLPKLTDAQRRMMNGSLTIREICDAIKSNKCSD